MSTFHITLKEPRIIDPSWIFWTFVLSRSTKISIELNFRLGIYVPYIIKTTAPPPPPNGGLSLTDFFLTGRGLVQGPSLFNPRPNMPLCFSYTEHAGSGWPYIFVCTHCVIGTKNLHEQRTKMRLGSLGPRMFHLGLMVITTIIAFSFAVHCAFMRPLHIRLMQNFVQFLQSHVMLKSGRF